MHSAAGQINTESGSQWQWQQLFKFKGDVFVEDKEAHSFYNLCVPEIALLTSTLVLHWTAPF